ncbi:unnamed protein product, partial [Dibothriocephalus latus]
MRTTAVEKALQPPGSAAGGAPVSKDHPLSNGVRQAKALNEERVLMMAAIAQEVAEQSDRYSTELQMELKRLETENAGLRELLEIRMKEQPRPQSSS